MSKSAAFARIKQQVLQITACVPFGRVTTFAAIGQHLDVVPRHVAYLLATLTPEEKELLPWYRVVGEQGLVAQGKKDQELCCKPKATPLMPRTSLRRSSPFPLARAPPGCRRKRGR